MAAGVEDVPDHLTDRLSYSQHHDRILAGVEGKQLADWAQKSSVTHEKLVAVGSAGRRGESSSRHPRWQGK
jgi:hypothetical protein